MSFLNKTCKIAFPHLTEYLAKHSGQISEVFVKRQNRLTKTSCWQRKTMRKAEATAWRCILTWLGLSWLHNDSGVKPVMWGRTTASIYIYSRSLAGNFKVDWPNASLPLFRSPISFVNKEKTTYLRIVGRKGIVDAKKPGASFKIQNLKDIIHLKQRAKVIQFDFFHVWVFELHEWPFSIESRGSWSWRFS